MDKQKRFPYYTKKQQLGIIFLIIIIVGIQLSYYFYRSNNLFDANINLTSVQKQWLENQIKIDSLNISKPDSSYKIYPFNPNFITDFKGYQLGMSVEEIDRLHQFRSKNKFVNSAQEFQNVTQVSDSLLNTIKGYFKFPDWVNNPKKNTYSNKEYTNNHKDYNSKKTDIQIKDFNTASLEDFMALPGIGEAFAQRIVTERDKFGGFLSLNQVDDIWGLSPQAIQNLKKYFVIKDISSVKKIKINDASINEISKIPYLRYSISKEIVIYRSKYGDFKTIEDLEKVNTFPTEKSNIIKLYLEF